MTQNLSARVVDIFLAPAADIQNASPVGVLSMWCVFIAGARIYPLGEKEHSAAPCLLEAALEDETWLIQWATSLGL